MAIYYRGPYARVTHKVLEVWRPIHRSYQIRDLSGVRIELVSGARWWTRRSQRRIAARYRGRDVVLYQDPDPRRLAQVARALTRSLEAAGAMRAFAI
jgi:hypothetical protein